VEEVETFTYLGCITDKQEGIDADDVKATTGKQEQHFYNSRTGIPKPLQSTPNIRSGSSSPA